MFGHQAGQLVLQTQSCARGGSHAYQDAIDVLGVGIGVIAALVLCAQVNFRLVGSSFFSKLSFLQSHLTF